MREKYVPGLMMRGLSIICVRAFSESRLQTSLERKGSDAS